MKLLILRILFGIGIFAGTLLFGLLPLKIIRKQDDDIKPGSIRSHRIMALLNCFSGGVFLGTCFLALLPAARMKLTDLLGQEGVTLSYPVSEVFLMIGFIFILMVEQVVLTCQKRDCCMPSFRENTLELAMVNMGSPEAMRRLVDDSSESEDMKELGDSHQTINRKPNHKMNGGRHHHDNKELGHTHLDLDNTGPMRAIILLLALSVHSLLEGMAFGLQEDTPRIINLFIAIIIHESLASLAFGVSLVRTPRSTRAVFFFVLLFCIMLPVGIGIGITIETAPGLTAQFISAFLQSFAAGTFVYVSFFEILMHEFEPDSDRILKVIFLIVGVSTIAALQLMD
ncbi:zinc transporter ZIP3-like [Saccoglossus kowalevskii]|uniref:Zinc transporter ZIP3 n=1 Tax=Saccoglossus kowalevskii TaxID=10224 RepID=A0ABM0GR71_SACKO|nr:PREDICTED: zinc transporter ZIP3-like [Saccoglossus kowalevskii]